MATLLYPPTDNDLQKQLNANYTVGATTITLNNTTSVQNLPGSIVINRIDTNGGLLPSSGRTYYTYTGTSGATLTGVALADGTDQDHAIGQVVEFVPDISWAQAINDVITTEHNADGTHKSALVTTLKATGAVVDTGTSDITIVTPKAIADSAVTTATKTQTLTNKTLTKPVINGTNPTAATYTPATGSQTVALDVSANNMHFVTGHASGTAITFTITGATNNQPFIVSITQGAVVSTIAAWFATIRWAGGSAPTLTATINKRDVFGFIRTGADTYDGFVVGQNL